MKINIFHIFKKKSLNYIFIFFIIILITSLLFIWLRSLWLINRQPFFSWKRIVSDFFWNHRKKIDDVNYIESWMTFHYINIIFKVPENYLKDKLNIVDEKYPNISLLKYMNKNNINNVEFLNKLKWVLGEYIKQNPIK